MEAQDMGKEKGRSRRKDDRGVRRIARGFACLSGAILNGERPRRTYVRRGLWRAQESQACPWGYQQDRQGHYESLRGETVGQ